MEAPSHETGQPGYHRIAVLLTQKYASTDWHKLDAKERIVISDLVELGYLAPTENGFVGKALTNV